MGIESEECQVEFLDFYFLFHTQFIETIWKNYISNESTKTQFQKSWSIIIETNTIAFAN